MIVLTGANGFIGTNVMAHWKQSGRNDLIAVDDFPSIRGEGVQTTPPANIRYRAQAEGFQFLDLADLPLWLETQGDDVEAVLHLGAISDTSETDRDRIMRLNFDYTQALWHWCTQAARPLVYASSAGTYGDGTLGYDDQSDPSQFTPLSLYAESKQRFDLWALEQTETPPHWAGLKFFNVYGPYESHKGHMASVIAHAHRQIRESGVVRLFQSHREGIADGGQMRDFIFVEDVVQASLYLMNLDGSASFESGLYNVGTGTARTFKDLALAVFAAMEREPNIVYIPTPEHLRAQYQYHTEATTEKLRSTGYTRPFHTLGEGAHKYVTGWLSVGEDDASSHAA